MKNIFDIDLRPAAENSLKEAVDLYFGSKISMNPRSGSIFLNPAEVEKLGIVPSSLANAWDNFTYAVSSNYKNCLNNAEDKYHDVNTDSTETTKTTLDAPFIWYSVLKDIPKNILRETFLNNSFKFLGSSRSSKCAAATFSDNALGKDVYFFVVKEYGTTEVNIDACTLIIASMVQTKIDFRCA